MFSDTHSQKGKFIPLSHLIWFILAFQSGTINVGGFLACNRFVTHITGFATHFGDELAIGDYLLAGKMMIVPLFFLLGAITSGTLVDRRILHKKRPNYTFIFFFIGLLMLLVLGGHWAQDFSQFGSPQNPDTEFLILAILSLASGLQNAMVTTVSGTLVRTTHLTGVTTDFGLGIARMLFPLPENERKKETAANLLRGGLIFSFIFGSVIGGVLFHKIGFIGFTLPALISFSLAMYARMLTLRNRKLGNI